MPSVTTNTSNGTKEFDPDATFNSKTNCYKNGFPNYQSKELIVKIHSEDVGYSLFSNCNFVAGSIIYECPVYYSELRKSPDMHTIQVTKDWHWCTKKQPIQFTQHSCFEMNCRFELEEVEEAGGEEGFSHGKNGVGGKCDVDPVFARFHLIATKNIRAGTVLTVNYNSFEWEMSCSFFDADAGREVRGFQYAMPDEKTILQKNALLFNHIKQRMVE